MKSNRIITEIVKRPGNRELTGCYPVKVISVEEKPNNNQDEYRQIFENIDALIVRINNLGVITEINSKVEKIYGFSRNELLRKDIVSLGIIKDKELPVITKAFNDAMKGRLSAFHRELETFDKAGDTKYIDANCTVIKKYDKIDGIICIISDITEREITEEKLRSSERKYINLVEQGNDGIIIIQDYVFKYANSKIQDIFGYTCEEVVGKQIFTDIVEEHRDMVLERYRKRLAGEQVPQKYEFDIINKQGERVCLEVNASLIEYEGRPADMAIVRDITERKKGEEIRHKSEETFAKVFSSSPNPICVISIEKETFIDINQSAEHFSGYAREEVIGRSVAELGFCVNEDDLNMLRRALQRNGRIVNFESSYRTKSGDIRFCLFSGEKINISGKKCLILVITDVTEQKRAEEALRESEEFTSSLLMNTPNPIFVTYPDSAIKYVNPAFEKLTGYSMSEIIGMKSPYPWWPEETKEQINTVIRASKFGHGSKTEMIYKKKSGEHFRVELSATRVNNNGQRRYVLVNWNDITERKQMEIALRESEEKFSKAFGSASDAMAITFSGNGKFLEVNESYLKLSGYSREELIGHNADELGMWAVQEDRERILRATLEKEQVVREQFSFKTKTGEIRTCLFSAESFLISNERRMIIIVQDITEDKQMEIALRESEEKFSKAFNASANSICITSLEDNRFLEVNEGYSRFTEYTREEVIGHTARELGLWVNDREFNEFNNKLLKKKRFHNLEIRSRSKTGEIRTGLASAEKINIGGRRCRIVVITDITERKQAEESLRISEEKFSKAFLASPGAIAISTLKDGRFIEVNDSFCQIMGYSREEIIGRTTKHLNIWGNENIRNNIVEQLENAEHPRNIMVKFFKKSGEIGTGMYSAEKIIIGNEPCIISVNMEITQQIKAEEGLRLLSSVTQQVTDSIVVTDPDFKITYMNYAAQNLFNYTIDEALGTDIGLFDAIPIHSNTLKSMQATLASGQTLTEESLKRRRDGSTFLCDCRRSPLFDESGQLSSYIIVHRDITRQKETEAKLKAQKLMVESILSTMPEGVLVTDSRDRIILANESFRHIFHTGRNSIKNRLLNEIISVGQLFDVYTAIKNDQSDNNSLEFRYKDKDLEKIIDSVIIKMDNDRMLIIFSDISREREEEAKLYLMDRLASLGEMAAGLAHELNNPLTGILTLSHLLVNSNLSDEYKEDLQCIYGEARRAANIVKNVLLFTRNNNYENGSSSVNEVVKEVLRLREHEEVVKNISVDIKLEDNLPQIKLDKYQLQQVFLNIILNAEAAIEETKKPGTLTVTTERINHHVNIVFSDTGCGIKKNVLARIFDPFFTTKEIGKGTGLGLSICYGIIVKHGGKISVKTQVGKGTSFTIKMPIVN